MRAKPWLFLPVLLLAGQALAGACGGTIVTRGDEEDGGLADGAPDAKKDGPWGQGGKDAGKDAFKDYVDPGCPDAGPPHTEYQCDPYAQDNGDCPPEDQFDCYIDVEYPSEPCGQETYRTLCAPAGHGTQGDPCGDNGDWCKGGYVCVITGSGTQCVQLCSLEGNDGCPDGLVCEPIDVAGFGGCL